MNPVNPVNDSLALSSYTCTTEASPNSTDHQEVHVVHEVHDSFGPSTLEPGGLHGLDLYHGLARKVVIMPTGAVIGLTIGLPVFFVVFVLLRRSKTQD